MVQCVLAGDAVADPVDPAQGLDIDVDQLARSVPLIADHRWPGLEQDQPIEAEPAQDQPDRGQGHAECPGNRRAGHPFAAQRLDPGHLLLGQPPGTAVGSRAAIS